MNPEGTRVGDWIKLAQNDLYGAKIDLDANPPLPEDACFHAQQAAEKSLKAWLDQNKIEFPWTHNLRYLLQLCVREEPAFERFQTTLPELTDYAVRNRYSVSSDTIESDKAQSALDAAREVNRFVLER